MASYFVLFDPIIYKLKQSQKQSARGIFEEMSVWSQCLKTFVIRKKQTEAFLKNNGFESTINWNPITSQHHLIIKITDVSPLFMTIQASFTGQRIRYLNSCQLTITWMSIIKLNTYFTDMSSSKVWHLTSANILGLRMGYFVATMTKFYCRWCSTAHGHGINYFTLLLY